MARDSSMGGGRDGGGIGGGVSGGMNSGAGGDRADELRQRREGARSQQSAYENARIQAEINKAILAGDKARVDELNAELLHAAGGGNTGSSGGFMGGLGDLLNKTSGYGSDGYYSKNDKRYAEKTYAAITRQQYADWESRFLPQQRQLMALARDESLAKQQLARIDGNMANSQRQAELGQSNQLARMGVAAERNGNDHSQGLRQALATAGSKNAVRSHEQDRQLGILTGAPAQVREQMDIGGDS